MFANLPSSSELETGCFGRRRGWKNIRWYEYLFLTISILAVIISDVLTIVRLLSAKQDDNDFAYGILLIVHSLFLLIFLFTGIFCQRIIDILTFLLCALLLTAYVVIHFFTRQKTSLPPASSTSWSSPQTTVANWSETSMFTATSYSFISSSTVASNKDQYNLRLISTLILNLRNINEYQTLDKIFLGVGVPLVFIWLCIAVLMVQLENRVLVGVFYVLSLLQPAHIGYIIYVAITDSKRPEKPSSANLVPLLSVLYVCVGINLVTHLLALVFGGLCAKNFGKGLKEKGL
ncbi:unnamed protein product [Didymodactylos carnosus]|uniref:DUF7789 domain-containing protein n=1 Tax=Didymodactylos carnosus TaxID=1234261 RepID=A0A814J1G3_9BILA|nr:unnamed protein product [Didymodactylos carnosus]CAF3802720.1 unnamed protein product [Didymodactylos carnosus]